jgi:hypothetical protein
VRPVHAGEADVLGPSTKNLLTLVTSDPPYVATGRIVVTAALSGKPAAEPPHATPLVGPSESGLSGEAGAVPAAVILVELLIAAVLGVAWISRRISRRVAWLLGVPVVLALAWATFSVLTRLLPATL